MEKKTIPLIAVGRTPTNNKRYKAKSNYCILCRSLYQKHEAHEHMHSMLHHRELETAMGKDTFHDCQACKVSELSFDEYAKHISTSQHNAKLKTLNSKNVSPTPLWNTLGPAILQQIKERNKLLKFQEKKEIKKKRKRQKQEAGRKHVEMMKGATGKNKGVSKVAKAEKSKQVKNARILKQMQKTHQGGSNKAFLKNIENKVSSLQRPPHQRPPHQKEATLQNQSERSSSLSGGQTLHQNNVRDQFTQSIQQMSYDVNNPSSKVKMEITQSDRLLNGLKNTQGGTSSMPGQKTWPANSQCGYNYKQLSSTSDCDFTSDNLPKNGGLIFDHYESDGSSQAGQEGSNSAKPASENNTATIRDVDVSAMLRHIRRALGVREPCRADREARRQNSEADNRLADLSTMHQIGAEKEQPGGRSNSSQVNSPAPPSGSGIHTYNTAQAKSKQETLGVTQRVTQPVEKSSVVEGGSNGALSGGPRESQVALKSQALVNQHSGQTATSETNVNIAPKVRVARKTTSNLTNLSDQSKQSWTEMYKEMKWKKLERVKGMPRFGIEVVNQTDRERKTQAEDNDFPLSEGFHWESFPDSPSAAHWTGLPPPPPQDNVANNCHIATQSNLQMQEPLEQPAAGQDDNQTAEAVHVKEEPNLEREDVEKRSNSVTNKRKPNVVVHDGASDEQPSRKRKKSKPHKDQDQMDQLLAVSLREEELSHSLQDLDNSLVQARNALQAAYTEVQRLLLFRQQCTAEINSLRAKRIEILQGMQGVYSGASNAAEIATTSSAGAVTVMQPRPSPLPTSAAFHTASNQQPLPTNPTSTVSQPHPTPLDRQLKQEMCEGPTVSCNPDKPQVPVNQPVHLFPPNLLPSLLLTSPHLAAPTAAFNPLPHLRAESSTSVNTSPESSSRLQGQTVKEGLNDRIQMVNLVEDEEQEVDPEEEYLPTKENASSASLVDNKGNESDDSVEMMEPSDMVVIDIDESDNEEAVSNVPVHKDPPQKSVSVEFSSAGSQTNQKNNAERKVQPAVKHTGDPPESVELCDDEKLYLGTFMNHTGSVHGLQIHDGRLYTCSGDNTARAYSLMSKECQVVFEGHTNKVNCLVVASLPNLPVRLYTGSSDQTIRCYSTKTNRCLEQITLSDRVLCLHIAWNILFAGLANGSVASYDLKTLKQLDVFECHGPRGVSCLGTAQEGARRVLLVGSYDSTISVRDAKSGLLLRSLDGHTKTVLCMKVVNDLVFSGSSDTSVHAYNIHTGELVRIYKGHGHAVTSIVILGKVMVTASLDKLVRVYELQSHDRLQVYGGHSDMVMCMAVHKSVIYTGCYDGSVQAVKLNLMKNYRCWWQNCSLIFGLAEHLVQHLVRDHSNPNLQTVKCRWRSCSAFFSTQQSVRQELPEHMKSHVEKDSRVQP